MDTHQIRGSLEKFRSELSKTIAINEMIVFGSYAKGTATNVSDVDVVVVSDDFVKMRSDERFNILDTACREIVLDIQAWGVTSDEFNRVEKASTLGQVKKFGVRV